MLDSAFAHPSVFVRLKKKTNIAHVRHTYGFSGKTDDKEIYDLATKENRFVVTIDYDFKKLVKPNKSGVFIIPPYLTNEEIDRIVCDFLSGKDPNNYVGKAVKI